MTIRQSHAYRGLCAMLQSVFALGALLAGSVLTAHAAKVETLTIASGSMHKEIPVSVITPDGYDAGGAGYPTVYLLHGYSANHTQWANDLPATAGLADRHQVIIVCPDGGFSSWYWDSPVDPEFKYETHVIDEVIPFIDGHYHTIRDRTGRAISGLSMGGHGALYLAFRHQDIFGAAGSMSGGVDIRPFPENWDIAKRLGDYSSHPDVWDSHSVIDLTYLLHKDHLALIFDCGTDDFFSGVNRKLHEKLLYLNIPHDYTERPGAHNGTYWNNAVEYQVLFFRRYFDRARASPAP